MDSIVTDDVDFSNLTLCNMEVETAFIADNTIIDFDSSIAIDSDIIWDDATVEYTIELPGTVTIEGVPLSNYIKKEANMNYLTVGNVLLMVVVCVVTVKFIIPRLNIRWVVRKFKNFIYRPFKKVEGEAKVAWDKAETEAKDVWKE